MIVEKRIKGSWTRYEQIKKEFLEMAQTVMLAVRYPKANEFLTNVLEALEAYASENARLLVRVKELEELAEADKDGRLVVLPCKVGDTVYKYNPECNVCRKYVDDPALCCDCICESCIVEMPFNYWLLGEFGKTIFLTREEAEAALRKEQDNGMD